MHVWRTSVGCSEMLLVQMAIESEWVEGRGIEEERWPWWETNNEAVVVCTLNTHTLVLRRRRRRSATFFPPEGSSLSLKPFASFIFPPSSLSQVRPGRPVAASLSLDVLPERWRHILYLSRLTSWVAPLQMFCRLHLTHRWDPSNQSSQLPLKSHHFPSSRIDSCLIYLKVCQSDFILTRQNSWSVKVFDFLFSPKLGSIN